MKKRISWFAIVLMIFVAGSSRAGATAVRGGASLCDQPRDLLQIKVFRTPDLDTQARVDSEGLITMPLIGRNSCGWSRHQPCCERRSRKQLTKANLIRNLPVTVFVSENATQKASVIGEVQNARPGAAGGRGAITGCFGYSRRAAANGIGRLFSIAHKDRPKEVEEVHIHGTLAGIENPTIMPGDTLLARESGHRLCGGRREISPAGSFSKTERQLPSFRRWPWLKGTSPRRRSASRS